MSSNFRILLYFLKTLDDTIWITSGLRSNPNFFNRIKQNLNETIRIDSTKNPLRCPQSSSSELNLKPNVNLNSLIDDAAIVLEGVKQYTEYVAKNKLDTNNKIPLENLIDLNKKIDKKVNISDIPEYVPSSTIPPLDPTKFKDQNWLQQQQQLIKNPEPVKESIPRFEESQVKPIIPETKSTIKTDKKSLTRSKPETELSKKSKERKVPSNRITRVMSFGGLAMSMGFGAMEELGKRIIGTSENQTTTDKSILGSNLFLTKNNAQKIVDTLCRVRGAALKLGQMLSIQDNEFLGPELQQIFERVRQSADYMPEYQLIGMLSQELGDDWQKRFKNFDLRPFAAASIGQVHKAQLPNDDSFVAVKVQYPGVAESIESDIKNVLSIIKYANIFPEGLFLDHIMAYAKKELSWEVDYIREAQCQIKYQNFIKEYSYPDENLKVPNVYEELSTKKVLTSELITGIPIDKMDDFLETSDAAVKNSVLERVLRLFFRELFQFNYMQTDPNWSNFFYDYQTDTLSLIDFGNCRPFSEEFVEKYKEIIIAAIENDRQKILIKSQEIGFLSGFETEAFKNAHVDSVLIVGEALRISEKFDFGHQSVVKRINNQIPVLLKYRLKPPPEEIYSLHRKLSGLFLLCCKLNGQINCRKIFDDIVESTTK